MIGDMQRWTPNVASIIEHAKEFHPTKEVISRMVSGDIHRTNYSEIHSRARKFSKSLIKLGVKKSDVIGTLAWNTHRHLETWYGITGVGAIYHTLNPRLFLEQLEYIINHADNKYIIADITFVKILEGIEARLPNVKGFIFLTDSANMPETNLKNIFCYEDMLKAEDNDYEWLKVEV